MTVQCIKLISGEEIIGDVQSNKNEFVLKVKDPAGIHMMPGQGGQLSIALIPWLPYGEQTSYEIAKDNILVTPFNPSVELLNRYNQLFGSGIQIANNLPPSKLY